MATKVTRSTEVKPNQIAKDAIKDIQSTTINERDDSTTPVEMARINKGNDILFVLPYFLG